MGRRIISVCIFMLTATAVTRAQASNHDSAIVQLQRQLEEMRSQMAKMQNRIAELQAQVDAMTGSPRQGSQATNSSTHAIPPQIQTSHNIYEATVGYWYGLYQGEHGRIEQGNQVVYIQRNLWSDVGGALQGSDVVAYTTLRFYLP
jgi:TolA-binding protein